MSRHGRCPYCGEPVDDHEEARPFFGIPLYLCPEAPPNGVAVIKDPPQKEGLRP